MTDPRHFTIKEPVEDVFVGQYRVSGYAVQKCLQHTLPAGNHSRILLCLCLFDSIVSYTLFRRYGRYNECWVQFDQI